MLHLCPRRGCSGTFDLTEDDLGRTVTCARCGSVLTMEESGLRLREEPPLLLDAAEHSEPAAPRAPAPALPTETAPMPRTDGGSHVLNQLLVGLFGLGSVLVIVFLFLPLVDAARLLSRKAEIDLGDAKEMRKEGLDPDKRFPAERPPRFDKEGKDKDAKGKADSRDEKGRAEEREAWKKKRQSLEEESDELRAASRKAQLVYTLGMLVGSLLLAVSAVGFLAAGPTTTRRVVGAVIITAEILLIFVVYMVRSTTASLIG